MLYRPPVPPVPNLSPCSPSPFAAPVILANLSAPRWLILSLRACAFLRRSSAAASSAIFWNIASTSRNLFTCWLHTMDLFKPASSTSSSKGKQAATFQDSTLVLVRESLPLFNAGPDVLMSSCPLLAHRLARECRPTRCRPTHTLPRAGKHRMLEGKISYPACCSTRLRGRSSEG